MHWLCLNTMADCCTEGISGAWKTVNPLVLKHPETHMSSEQNFAIRFLQIQSLQVISNLIMYKTIRSKGKLLGLCDCSSALFEMMTFQQLNFNKLTKAGTHSLNQSFSTVGPWPSLGYYILGAEEKLSVLCHQGPRNHNAASHHLVAGRHHSVVEHTPIGSSRRSQLQTFGWCVEKFLKWKKWKWMWCHTLLKGLGFAQVQAWLNQVQLCEQT